MIRILLAAASAAALLAFATPSFATDRSSSPTRRTTPSPCSTATRWSSQDHQGLAASARHRAQPRLQGAVRGRRRRRHHGCDRHRHPGSSRAARIRTRPGADGDRSAGQDHLHRQRGRQPRHHHGHQERRHPRRGAGRRRARRHGREPRRQIHRRHLRKHQHGPCHRQRHQQADRQRAGRLPPARGEVHPRRQGAVGLLRGRRHHLGDRSQDLEGHQEDHLRGPRRSSRAAAAGRHGLHQGRQDLFVAAWPRPTASL